MKTTTVRVTRVQKLTVTETVEIPIVQEDDDAAYPSATDKALALVKALDDAGHDVDWRVVSEVPDAYAHNTTWKTETVPEATSE